MNCSHLVFGYGSLMNLARLQQYLGRDLTPGLDYRFCSLKNFQRCWNVAMDNRVDLPGYKYYVDCNTGNRFDGFVTFINVRPQRNQRIMGILFAVGDRELANLDRRERNYQRINVTNNVDIEVQSPIWTYIGLEQAEKRYQQGLKQSNGTISQAYWNSIHQAYLSLGKKAFANYIRTTDCPEIPVRDLEMLPVINQ